LVEYCKRYRPPLRHLAFLGLNDSLSRQFVLGCRNKITYGLYWLAKIPKTRREVLETWFCNLQRAWLGARNRISRNLVYEASGLPKIMDFGSYLLLKRSHFWGRKKLTTRPTSSVQEIMNRPNASEYVSPRQSTRDRSAEADFDLFLRSTNSASAWLGDILKRNPDLSAAYLANSPPKWEDSKFRVALDAATVHCTELWTKAQRLQTFSDNYPEY